MATVRIANDASTNVEQPRLVPTWLRAISTFGTLVWFVMRDFFRSPWIVLDVLAVGALHLFLLGPVPEGSPAPSRDQFFGVVYFFMMALSAINTLAIFSRANGPQTYPILARPVTRTAYVVAGVVAAWVVSFLAYLLLTALAYLRFGPPFQSPPLEWTDLATYLQASLAVLVAVAFAVSLLTLLAAFVSPFWVRFLVLAVITLLIMSFDPRDFPIPGLGDTIARFPPLLAPIAGGLRFATQSPPDSLALASVVIVAAYTSTILALVLWLSTRREVVLD